MDAITLLKDDHKTLQRHFRAFESAQPRAKVARTNAVSTALRELAVHSAIEEQIFYPAIREEAPDTLSEVLESLEEHHVMKWLCAEIERASVDDERYEAKVTVLIENTRHHIRDEEDELFPMVREALGRKRLAEIGELLDKARLLAPTHPHPRSPDTPPGNLVVGVMAGAIDRARDMGQRLVGHLTP